MNTESVSDFLVSFLLISCQLTSRAKLGSKAYGFLKKGKATPDQLLVDIMVESVRWSAFHCALWLRQYVLATEFTSTRSIAFNEIIMFFRQVPEGTGWIMDGFPSTTSQAKVTVFDMICYSRTSLNHWPLCGPVQFLGSPNFKILVVVRIKTVNARKGLWVR